MPRRYRPPATAREIAAYLSGYRAAVSVGHLNLTQPELADMAERAVVSDSPIAAAMRIEDYVYWYTRGYTEEVVRVWKL